MPKIFPLLSTFVLSVVHFIMGQSIEKIIKEAQEDGATELNLNKHNIGHIPDTIASLPLVRLNLSENSLKDLPPSIAKVLNLLSF